MRITPAPYATMDRAERPCREWVSLVSKPRQIAAERRRRGPLRRARVCALWPFGL